MGYVDGNSDSFDAQPHANEYVPGGQAGLRGAGLVGWQLEHSARSEDDSSAGRLRRVG